MVFKGNKQKRTCCAAPCTFIDAKGKPCTAKPTPKPKTCGAPKVNWKTATDNKAPEGWKIAGFNGNVGNKRLCANGWNAYANGNKQGTLSTTMEGSGTVTIKFRDCWKEGTATVYLNDKQKGVTKNDKKGSQKTVSFKFKNGDKLTFKDTGNNGVLHITSITSKCTGPASPRAAK
jgi:hypothetical protein